MNAVVERSENSQVTLKVEVEPERVAKATDRAYQRLVQRVSVPGFRRGKAPRRILERTLGLDALYREALDFVMPSAYEEAVQESKISPYASPEFEVVQLEPDKPLIFKAVVPVQPKLALGDYKSITLTPEEVSVQDDEVAQALENIRQANAVWSPVEDRAVQVGDQVGIDVVTSVDGVALAGGKAQDGVAELDSESPYPRWANALAGMNVGEEKEVSDEVSADAAQRSIAGKTLLHKVTVKSIKQKELPDLDDDLARSLGDFDDLSALKADLTERLRKQKRLQSQSAFEQAVLAALVERTTFEFPGVMVDEEMTRLLRQADYRFRQQGVSLETYLNATGKSVDDLREQWRPQAVDRLKSNLALDEVAVQEGITASEAEIAVEAKEMVDLAAADRRQDVERLVADPHTLEAIAREVIHREALKKLVEFAGGKGLFEPEPEKEQSEPPQAIELAPAVE